MIGRDVGNYRITALLGEGGMGLVYLGEHTKIDRKVAVKVLRGDLTASPDAMSRFMNEARVASTIRHPNVIEVFDTGMLQPEAVPFIVMELLEGQALDARIAAAGRIDIPDALRWTNETAAALAVAHAKGVIHRDLKPANLFLVADDREEGREKIKVLDFGIAKLRGAMGGGSHTQTGSIMGTPLYMSPEQCRGTKEIDTRSDIYSLGIIVYEMLCGAPPFVSSGFGELISMHLNSQPEPLRARNPDIGESLEATVLRALAKNPDERFATVQELQVALGFEPTRVGRATPLAPGPAVRPTGDKAAYTPPGASPSTPRVSGTQISNPSIAYTPPRVTPAGGPHAGGGATPAARTRSGRWPAIAGGIAIMLAILLGVAHGQLGARIKCLIGSGCTEVGDCYNAGKCGLVKDQRRACEIYDKDCTAGNTPSCVRLGRCYEAHTGGVATSWLRACDLYDKACNSENMAGCAHLANCYREGIIGREKDEDRACELSKRACDNGDQYGCAVVSTCYRQGARGIAVDKKHACDLEKQSCDAGELFGCTMLSSCYAEDPAPPPYSGGAEKMCQTVDTSCAAGEAMGCQILALCYGNGIGGYPKNKERACELARTACDDGGLEAVESEACDGIASCYEEGTGNLPKDPDRGLAIRQRSCDDGYKAGCITVADRLNTGSNGVVKDSARACALFEKICASGARCIDAARCNCAGTGVARNSARAHELYRKACAAGDKTACAEDDAARCEDQVAGSVSPPPSAAAPRSAQAASPPGVTPVASGRPTSLPPGHRLGSAQLHRERATKGKAAKSGADDSFYNDAE